MIHIDTQTLANNNKNAIIVLQFFIKKAKGMREGLGTA
jgi:hypothetical protein